MAKGITIKHPSTGVTKTGYYGFSWTYLFFGPLVPFLRGEFGVGALHLLFSIFTLGIWLIIEAFLYNKQYMIRMLTEKGWVLAGSKTDNELAKRALGIVGTLIESD